MALTPVVAMGLREAGEEVMRRFLGLRFAEIGPMEGSNGGVMRVG